MDELSIKIKIADREYPMKVKPEDEERVRNAGKSINERIRSYRERFGIDDKQDLLAMVAFDCMAEHMKTEKNNSQQKNTLSKIIQLNNTIEHFIHKQAT